jgi:hypothetical protein
MIPQDSLPDFLHTESGRAEFMEYYRSVKGMVMFVVNKDGRGNAKVLKVVEWTEFAL